MSPLPPPLSECRPRDTQSSGPLLFLSTSFVEKPLRAGGTGRLLDISRCALGPAIRSAGFVAVSYFIEQLVAVGRCGLHFPFPAAQLKLMGRRVVLNLFTGRELILTRRRRRRVADSVPPAERR